MKDYSIFDAFDTEVKNMSHTLDRENKMNIPFSPPDISEAEIAEVADALRSGWITTGPKTKLLEKKIAEWVGTPKCVCLNSQTACAETTLRILGIGEGDEVITTAYTYTATASVVCHVGAKLVLVDCQKDSFEMDYDELEKVITEKTKVVIPASLNPITKYRRKSAESLLLQMRLILSVPHGTERWWVLLQIFPISVITQSKILQQLKAEP